MSTAAQQLRAEVTLSKAPNMLRWYARRIEILTAKGENLRDDERDEVAQLTTHLARERFGVADIGPKQRIAEAKREYQAAILRGDAKAAATAKTSIARLQEEEKTAREIRRAAPARVAIREAADSAARADAELREAERAKAQGEVDSVARELADAILVLHRLRLAVPQRCPSRPEAVVWHAAAQLVAADLQTLAPHALFPLAEAIRVSSF